MHAACACKASGNRMHVFAVGCVAVVIRSIRSTSMSSWNRPAVLDTEREGERCRLHLSRSGYGRGQACCVRGPMARGHG